MKGKKLDLESRHGTDIDRVETLEKDIQAERRGKGLGNRHLDYAASSYLIYGPGSKLGPYFNLGAKDESLV